MSAIRVIPFQPDYAGDFRRLNLEWIERLFEVEAPDRKVLDGREGAIMGKGGMIFFALDGEAVVGTVALIRIGEGRCELAKMAVAASHQRRGIGELLGALARVRRGARRLKRSSSRRTASSEMPFDSTNVSASAA